LTDFLKTQISNFMKICALGDEWRTERHDKANSRVSKFFERA